MLIVIEAPPPSMRSTPVNERPDPREATRRATTHTSGARRSPLHTVYLSAESLALVLVDEDERASQPEEVRALQPA
jgi:hypothetical protein